MATVLVGANLFYQIVEPSSFILKIAVAANDCQQVSNESARYSGGEIDQQQILIDANGGRYLRLDAEPGVLDVSYTAQVLIAPHLVPASTIVADAFNELPLDVLGFLNPSRYCESDKLARFAVTEFGQQPPGFALVSTICDWVFHHIAYQPGTTDGSTTACDVLIERSGVCRDFAHVAISLCRAMGIPARYVAGYAVDLAPPDFHGFVEVYLGGRWFLFDPTRLASVTGLVRIATGRDAADAAFATFVGEAYLNNMQVWANPVAVDDAPPTTVSEPSFVGVSTS